MAKAVTTAQSSYDISLPVVLSLCKMFIFKTVWDSWNEQFQIIHKHSFNNDMWFLYNISPQWMGNDVQRNWQYTGGTSVKVRNGEMKRHLGSSLGAASGSRITESWKTWANAQWAKSRWLLHMHFESAFLWGGVGSLTLVLSRSASGLVLGSLGISRVESFLWRLFYLNMCRGFLCVVWGFDEDSSYRCSNAVASLFMTSGLPKAVIKN